jgi:hypothetical protein
MEGIQERKRSKKENYGQFVLLLIGTLVFISMLGYGIVSAIHWYQTKDATLANLVKQVQADIKEIDANNSDWKVEEAEVELNFVVKDATTTSVDLKAAGGEIGTEKENSHRLVLKLRRVRPRSEGAANSADTGMVTPKENSATKKAKN